MMPPGALRPATSSPGERRYTTRRDVTLLHQSQIRLRLAQIQNEVAMSADLVGADIASTLVRRQITACTGPRHSADRR